MGKLLSRVLLIASLASPGFLIAQQEVCRSYIADSPEDELVRAVTGADSPQDQIAALDKYAQAHSDSKFMPCVDGFYAAAYFKLNNYDKVIEYGEKALALNNRELPLIDSVTYAFVASGKVSDVAFDAIVKAADQIKAVASPPRPSNVSDADWQKALQDAATQSSEWRDRMAGAFFQILPRVTDANKRIETLDKFAKAYPETTGKTAGQLNFQFAVAYAMANQIEKADDFAEKAIAADPTNVEALNLAAYDYAIQRRVNSDKAAGYAKKALELTQAMKKPEGMPDDQFKKVQNNTLGMAHLTLGYLAFLKAGKTHRVGPAIQEFKTAADLLEANPALQGQTLYLLGSAYENLYPANHQGAIEVLTRATNLQSPWQGQARDLLAKVRQATGGR